MKNIPITLLDYLLSPDVESTFYSDLITVELPSGLVMYITDGQLNITYLGNIYSATRWGGWECKTTDCELGALSSTATVDIVADDNILMPNWNIPLLQAIQEGLFDGSVVTIITTYGLSYGETDFGTVIRYSGQWTDSQKTGRTSATVTLKPYTFTLNQQMPREVLQPGCRWTLYDPNTCTVNKASFTYTGSAGPGTNNVIVVPSSSITTPTGITLEQGVITFTSGRNTGLSMSIQSWDGMNIRLSKPFLFPVALGDTFSVVAGCAHTQAACFSFLGNNAYIHYGGTPYIPNQESAV